MSQTREFNVAVHHEDGAYWAEVSELPGCFASGDSLDELRTSLEEAISLYLDDSAEEQSQTPRRKGKRGVAASHMEVDEMRVKIPA